MTDRPRGDGSRRLALFLFVTYTLFYAGFVAINAAAPQWMDRDVIAGLNLAIVYGFALIIVALVMAVVYGVAMSGTESVADDDGDRT